MSTRDFVHLHLHTQYSLLDGAIKIKPLMEYVKEQGMPAVAMTDHGNMFGAIEFYQTAQKQGVQPIIGCEVYVAPGSRFEKKDAKGSSEAAYHLVLLAQNYTGYQNLCALVSAGFQEGFYYKPRIDWDLLTEKNEGLLALSACLAGEVPTLLRLQQQDQARQRLQQMAGIFDQRLYLELQENGIEEQQVVNQGLKELGQELGLPLVATNDCHYLRQEDAQAHEALLCIQTNKTLDDPNRMRFPNDGFYVRTPQDMAQMFPDVPEALDNTLDIARRCADLSFDFNTYHFPAYDPSPKTLEEELQEQSHSGLQERLKALAQKRRDWDADKEQLYWQRLEQELAIIRQMGFPGYFLIVADFINWAKEQGIPVGPGRGSAAGSLVAFAMRITDIDPLEYSLLFERFLNPERISMPDIDVDFCINGREDVIRYVQEKYGADNVAQIITFGTMAARGVIRDVGRAMGMSFNEVDRIAKLVPEQLNITLQQALDQESRLVEMMQQDPQVKRLLEIGQALEGLTRHASTHAAGVVVTPEPLTHYLPLYKDPKSGGQVTQYSMKYVEDIGLVKFDFLGLKTLTVIHKAVELVRQGSNPDFDLELMPEDDADTFALLCRGDTTGVFQLESSGMKELMIKLKPECFEDLIALVALYRPGPLKSGMVDTFIRRKHGQEESQYDFPELEPILQETYGVILYQEQVMLIAQTLAGYSLGQADLLRRAMGKKKIEEMAKQKELFLQGAQQRGHDPQKAKQLYDNIANFAEYGFNKSHSAAYALIGYQTAYLKAQYPVEFMAALLTEDMGNTDKVVKNINEVRSQGISVLPPDINASQHNFTVHEGAIRFGLGAVKGTGQAALEAVLEARQDGPFASLGDFCERVDLRRVNKKVMEALVKCGAFDAFGEHRAQLLAALETMVPYGQRRQKQRQEAQNSLFGAEGMEAFREQEPPLPQVAPWSDREKLAHEKECLGFFITGHPLARYAETIRRWGSCSSAEIGHKSDRAEVQLCGMVNGIKETRTKKGDRMAFVTLEDQEGTLEVLVFPEAYKQAAELLQGDEPIWVQGTLDKGQPDQPKILASQIEPLSAIQARQTQQVKLRLEGAALAGSEQEQLQQLLKQYQGGTQVFLTLAPAPDYEVDIELPQEFWVDPGHDMVEAAQRLLGARAVTLA